VNVPVGKVADIQFLRMENRATIYAVGSGTYQFQSKLSGSKN
jgi:hypothetical protein